MMVFTAVHGFVWALVMMVAAMCGAVAVVATKGQVDGQAIAVAFSLIFLVSAASFGAPGSWRWILAPAFLLMLFIGLRLDAVPAQVVVAGLCVLCGVGAMRAGAWLPGREDRS